jgi:hypothetical protein
MRRYKVLSSRGVMGYPQGKTFSASIHPAHEKRLIGEGSLRLVKTRKGKKNG